MVLESSDPPSRCIPLFPDLMRHFASLIARISLAALIQLLGRFQSRKPTFNPLRLPTQSSPLYIFRRDPPRASRSSFNLYRSRRIPSRVSASQTWSNRPTPLHKQLNRSCHSLVSTNQIVSSNLWHEICGSRSRCSEYISEGGV